MNFKNDLDDFFDSIVEEDYHIEEVIESRFVDVSFFPYLKEANSLRLELNQSYLSDMYEMAPYTFIHFQRILVTIKSKFIYRKLHKLIYKCEP